MHFFVSISCWGRNFIPSLQKRYPSQITSELHAWKIDSFHMTCNWILVGAVRQIPMHVGEAKTRNNWGPLQKMPEHKATFVHESRLKEDWKDQQPIDDSGSEARRRKPMGVQASVHMPGGIWGQILVCLLIETIAASCISYTSNWVHALLRAETFTKYNFIKCNTLNLF